MESSVRIPIAEDPAPRPLPVLLLDRVRKLAEVRAMQVTAEGALRARRLHWEAENKEMIDLARELREQELQLELEIKSGAAKHCHATGEKTPCVGVGIRVGSAYEISDVSKAWEWIHEHKMEPQLTKPATLDEKAITKLASATELPFVTVLQKVTPTIATDLDQALAAEEAA